jgi:hypothetical protein
LLLLRGHVLAARVDRQHRLSSDLRRLEGSVDRASRHPAACQATISAIENEQTTGIDFAVLERLADALGVDPGFLIERLPR